MPTIKIQKSLALFSTGGGSLDQHFIITEGFHEVESIANPLIKDGEPWLKLAGQPWGNARSCWDALVARKQPRPLAFGAAWQCTAGLLGFACLCLCLSILAPAWVKKSHPNVPATKMELTSLLNELENLPHHYPLMASPAQKTYDQRAEDCIYGIDVYPPYVDYRNRLQSAMLPGHGNLDGYFAALNALDDQLYHAWHDWGLTNRPARIAELKKQRARFTSGEVMPDQSALYKALQASVLNDGMIQPCLAFNEKLEHEIGDPEPALREIARQNRDCAEHAIRLNVRINSLRAQLAPPEKKKKKLFQTADTR